MKKQLVYALIPARGGSKRLPGKNIRPLHGKPLIAYSILDALQCSMIDRVICSTDSPEIAAVATEYGAEVIMRPPELAGDESLDIDVFKHCLETLKNQDGKIPDILVQLRPTSPIRSIKEIEQGIQALIENPTIDSVRGVSLTKISPFLIWVKDQNGYLVPVVKDDLVIYSSKRKQDHPDTYLHNGVLDIMRTSVILEKKSMCGDKILPLVTEQDFDIDTLEDFELVEKHLHKNGKQ